MRISPQDGAASGVGTLAARAASVLVAMSLLGVSAVARAQQGQIRCAITENGSPASGSFAVEQGGRQVASGSCGRALSVPVGACSVTVRLNGALDNPAQTVNATVADGKTSTVAVDFKTAVLEVRIDAKGQRGTGMVTVEKNGRRIGTLGSGVAARLSAGSYEVIVRLGAQEQRHQVELRPGQRRLVRAQF